MIHRSQLSTLFLFVSLIMGQTGWSQSGSINYTLTSNGIGPVQLGVNPNELPESIPGLYASKSHSDPLAQYLSDDEDDDWGVFEGWEFLDEEGETVFTADVDSLGLICEITISSPNFLTAEGLHVGSSPQQVETVKGAQKILPNPMADFGRVSYQLNGITLWIDDFLIDDDHSEERVAQITIPAEDSTDDLYEMVNNVIASVYPHYSSSNSLQEMETHINEIRNIDGVQDVYSNGSTTLFVELDGGGSFSFSYFPKPIDVSGETIDSFTNGAFEIARDSRTKNPLDKFTIAFQMGKDSRFDNEKKLLGKAEKMLQDCGFKGKIKEASIEFFLNDMYNYDYAFINTHGMYDQKTGIHWLLTTTPASIKTEKEANEIKNDATLSREAKLEAILLKNIFNTYKQYYLDDLMSYAFIKEKRGSSMVPICYVSISENLFKSSKNRFNNQGNAIVFNSACESLKGNNGLADAFIGIGAGAYLGYDAINNASRDSGLEFFGRLLSGMTINKAYETIDKHLKSNRMGTWTAHLKLICPHIGESHLLYPKRAGHQFSFHKIDPNQNNTLDNQAIQFSTTYNIPLLFYTCHNNEPYLNQNHNAIPLEYGFELCKNSGFSKGQTYTIRMRINDEKAIPVSNEDFIYASCQLNGNTIILKLSFDMPVNHYPYWDPNQEYMHLRPIVFMKDSEPVNTGGTYHCYKNGSKGYNNCCYTVMGQ